MRAALSAAPRPDWLSLTHVTPPWLGRPGNESGEEPGGKRTGAREGKEGGAERSGARLAGEAPKPQPWARGSSWER